MLPGEAFSFLAGLVLARASKAWNVTREADELRSKLKLFVESLSFARFAVVQDWRRCFDCVDTFDAFDVCVDTVSLFSMLSLSITVSRFPTESSQWVPGGGVSAVCSNFRGNLVMCLLSVLILMKNSTWEDSYLAV